MSTPTEKPVNLTDPLTQISRATDERADPELDPIENDNAPTRSPYAPARVRKQSNTDRHSEENDRGPIRSRYAPNEARTKPLQSAAHDADIWNLRRLEASLRWIQREATAAQIPRAAQLRPVPGLTHRPAVEMSEFLLPRSLEPERMAAPPRTRSRRYKLGALLIMLIASIFAASAGYYVWTGDWTRSPQLAPGTQLASVGPKTNAPPSYVSQQDLLRDDARATSAENEISSLRPETSQLATPSSDGTVATLQPSATGSQARPSSTAIRVLDPDEINLLMKQGEQLIAAGDVVTARTVFQRAAEAGDANAAMA